MGGDQFMITLNAQAYSGGSRAYIDYTIQPKMGGKYDGKTLINNTGLFVIVPQDHIGTSNVPALTAHLNSIPRLTSTFTQTQLMEALMLQSSQIPHQHMELPPQLLGIPTNL